MLLTATRSRPDVASDIDHEIQLLAYLAGDLSAADLATLKRILMAYHTLYGLDAYQEGLAQLTICILRVLGVNRGILGLYLKVLVSY